MDYLQNLENLNERMLDFHHVLLAAKVYKSDVTTREFFELTHKSIEDTAQALLEEGGDPWLKLLHLPHLLLYDLAGVLHSVEWDTEDVAPDLFVKLRQLLSQSPFQFQWIFNQDQQTLTFTIDAFSWSVPCSHLDQEELWISPFQFTQLDPNLTTYLQSQGWYLYVPTGFDQVARFMLVALPAVQPLKRYLIPSFDSREEWFHNGIPDADKPASIWML